MKTLLSGSMSKFLVAAGSAAVTALSTQYGTQKWEPMVVAVIGAVLVYLVPNTSPPAR